MIPGFDRIVEERILNAQKSGMFDDLPCAGKPLALAEDSHIPAELRLAYKILKNADFTPPEIELKKEILRTEELLDRTTDVADQYKIVKKLNFLILKLNAMRDTAVQFEMPQIYFDKIAGRMASSAPKDKG